MTHPRLIFARLLAGLATTLLEIYESKHCHTQDLCMSIRPATVIDLLRLHIVYWSRPFVFYRKTDFFHLNQILSRTHVGFDSKRSLEVHQQKKKALAITRKCLILKVGHLGLEPRTSRL